MPHLTLRSVAVALSALCLCLSAQADTVEIFPFDPPASIYRTDTELRVGPEGDIWFIKGEPLRLMRIHEGELDCVHETDVHSPTYLDMVVGADGTIYIDNFQYQFTAEAGITGTGVIPPSLPSMYDSIIFPGTTDAEGRMFSVLSEWSPSYYGDGFDYIYEMYRNACPQYRMGISSIRSLLAVSPEEFWIVWKYDAPHRHYGPDLRRLNLDTGEVEETHAFHIDDFPVNRLCARDYEGRFWMTGEDIVTFDGEEFSTFAVADIWNRERYTWLSVAGDGDVWVALSADMGPGIARFIADERQVFNTEDGLLTDFSLYAPVIDYDGNVWVLSSCSYWAAQCLGIGMISDGGWPPMRLMLREVATEGTIAVEAQVINNGPVVGVDVYVALQMNGQRLFWPNWQPMPSPVQVNLRPGHNQTATIISAPRAHIPPGTYTFWACMTGRGTQKLIGPIDRKFETLTIEID